MSRRASSHRLCLAALPSRRTPSTAITTPASHRCQLTPLLSQHHISHSTPPPTDRVRPPQPHTLHPTSDRTRLYGSLTVCYCSLPDASRAGERAACSKSCCWRATRVGIQACTAVAVQSRRSTRARFSTMLATRSRRCALHRESRGFAGCGGLSIWRLEVFVPRRVCA
jgi:hypothetical protein